MFDEVRENNIAVLKEMGGKVPLRMKEFIRRVLDGKADLRVSGSLITALLLLIDSKVDSSIMLEELIATDDQFDKFMGDWYSKAPEAPLPPVKPKGAPQLFNSLTSSSSKMDVVAPSTMTVRTPETLGKDTDWAKKYINDVNDTFNKQSFGPNGKRLPWNDDPPNRSTEAE